MEAKKEKQTNRIVIDGENALLGRLASYAAKQALLGKNVIIVNSEKAVISGNRVSITNDYLIKRRRPHTHFPSMPERILKRTIRGMLPHRKGRGLDALRRVICYKGIPKEFENEKKIKSGKEKGNLLTVEEVSKMLK